MSPVAKLLRRTGEGLFGLAVLALYLILYRLALFGAFANAYAAFVKNAPFGIYGGCLALLEIFGWSGVGYGAAVFYMLRRCPRLSIRPHGRYLLGILGASFGVSLMLRLSPWGSGSDGELIVTLAGAGTFYLLAAGMLPHVTVAPEPATVLAGAEEDSYEALRQRYAGR